MIVQRAGKGFGALGAATGGKGCYATPDGKADDAIASLLGCPDCPGMSSLSPGYYKLCYQMKRPMGKILLFGALGAGLYAYMKRKT